VRDDVFKSQTCKVFLLPYVLAVSSFGGFILKLASYWVAGVAYGDVCG
jgi:hypothetical protein